MLPFPTADSDPPSHNNLSQHAASLPAPFFLILPPSLPSLATALSAHHTEGTLSSCDRYSSIVAAMKSGEGCQSGEAWEGVPLHVPSESQLREVVARSANNEMLRQYNKDHEQHMAHTEFMDGVKNLVSVVPPLNHPHFPSTSSCPQPAAPPPNPSPLSPQCTLTLPPPLSRTICVSKSAYRGRFGAIRTP